MKPTACFADDGKCQQWPLALTEFGFW